MSVDKTYALKDFETYCLTIIEMERMKARALGRVSKDVVEKIVVGLRVRIEKAIELPADVDFRGDKRQIMNGYILEFENELRGRIL